LKFKNAYDLATKLVFVAAMYKNVGVLNLALLIPEKNSGNAFSRNPEIL
jgi:hypothetical protein